MKLLHIDSSILGEGSASRELTREIVARWKAAHPDAEVTYLDLAAETLPHLSGGSLARSDESEAAKGAAALEQFLAADTIVIGAPVYNFTIPSQLKAWIDRIAVAGKTFRYGATGPEGLAGGKEVIVAISRGGVRAADASGEFVEPYLKHLFAFLGVHNVRFVRAEGLAISPAHRAASLSAAKATIAAHAPPAALAA
ncbi:MAG TPA: NAD(P)H-dependent oxidoreductase [Steroidobacteraceae bacterium]|jgi:FMN-dependent NADH-azoreductase|nr:NAD(P)H-dependent oxidoreductase [Steroidobacteraceae bacterium]